MSCDHRLLADVLVSDSQVISAGSPQERLLAEHLSNCDECQSKLSEIAAPQAWWCEASAVLAEPCINPNNIIVSHESGLSPDADIQIDEVSLAFLESSTRHDMLGRIGRYEVERVIGAGGMGIVLKAFDTDLNRTVAIKVLAPHLSSSGAARRRFAREAQAAAAVGHDNVIPIYDVQDAKPLPYLVMEYIPGESLQARVDRAGPLATEEILRIGAQIAEGLAAAHDKGLIHRDVKPGNILLHDGVDRVVISDFGLARTADDASLTRTGIVAGTPHYMSPEQARGTAIDFRSDQFGFGGVLFFMATGRPPFRADGAMAVLNQICHDPHVAVDALVTNLPAGLSKLIDRLLEKSPERRYSQMHDVAKQITSGLVEWRRPGRRRKTAILGRNRRLRLPLRWAIYSALLTAEIVAVGWLWGRTPPTSGTAARFYRFFHEPPTKIVRPLLTTSPLGLVPSPVPAEIASDLVFDGVNVAESTFTSTAIPEDDLERELAELSIELESLELSSESNGALVSPFVSDDTWSAEWMETMAALDEVTQGDQ